jgi:uncharacterized protein (TIGR03382 family)
MKRAFLLLALAGVAMAAAPAAAQVRMLQMDINGLAFQARNSAGAPAPFGGLSHTGSLVLQNQDPTSLLADIAIQTGGSGPFVPQPFSGTLGTTLVTINLNNGNVTGGSMMVHVGSDMYSTNINPVGNVATYVGGGFQIEGLTSGGMFSGPSFATVPIADFFANQGGGGLPGAFLNFRIQPNTSGAGFADLDLFVSNIPAPGAMALLGLGGLAASRRRR